MSFGKQLTSGCEIIILVSSAKSISLDRKLMVRGKSLMYRQKAKDQVLNLEELPCFITPQFE
jgi:hypothetical protein